CFGGGSPPLVTLVVLSWGLGLVFALVLTGRGRLANHLLARSVRVVGGRVGDDVLEVGQHLVVAGAAVDRVRLPVARVERVVPVAAVERVAGCVGGRPWRG